jgi:WhiB family redox-sensing transcriptional regulator
MASSLVLLTTQAKALDDPLPCHRENPELWFSELPAGLQLAKAYCQPCAMRRACLADAVERHEPHGVWGGEIFARGVIIAEKRPRGRPPGKLRPVIGVDARAIA